MVHTLVQERGEVSSPKLGRRGLSTNAFQAIAFEFLALLQWETQLFQASFLPAPCARVHPLGTGKRQVEVFGKRHEERAMLRRTLCDSGL